MSNHTPEPWQMSGDRIVQTSHITRDVWEIPHQEGDLERIVACVNALAGRDPARLGDLEKAAGNAQSILSLVRHRGLGNSIGQMKPEELEEYENAIRTALAAFRTPVAKAKEAQ